ncbi:MAG: filamentous hemagglutinin family protein [Pseudomonadota bacterium]|nr:filamentous hemagglutinin family protein [Pseudomonadota bacterium]
MAKRRLPPARPGASADLLKIDLSAHIARSMGVPTARSNPAMAGISALALLAAGAAEAHPPLPTPCSSGTCGSNASSFVTYGSAGASVSGSTLTVTQTTAKAILNWADFNIASGYKVNFAQPSSTAAVLNEIWSADPSHIAGSLSANGQVYLINQNGIVFDKGAQIDVASLTASTLYLSAKNFEDGIVSNNDNGSNDSVNAAFSQFPGSTTQSGTVTVSPGAVITTADGGRIMLLGTAVTNGGTLSAPDGQVILGAGNEVYLAASTDPSMRGFLIEVNAAGGTQQVIDSATGQSTAVGTVTNTGQITADRGNVTLAGFIVNQDGAIDATTSVSANGSIYLVAGDTSAVDSNGGAQQYYNAGAAGFGKLLPNKGGTLTLGSGSTTQVLADSTDTSTISEGNLAAGDFYASQVDLVGDTVTMRSDSTIRAPGATVNVYAAGDPYTTITNPAYAYGDGGTIDLESGSTIDVSGLTDVQVSATRDIIQVTLEGNDLANDPLLKNGFLHGTTVTVDVNKGSTLFDVSSYKNNIGIGINEVLTTAGTINLKANGSVKAQSGSTLNVSGGSVAYQGGYADSTTTLLGSDGKVYDISTAPKDITYVSVANSYSSTDSTWGTKTSASSKTYYAGYTQGKDAGKISVSAPQISLNGSLLATTVAGEYQRSGSSLAKGGQLVIGCDCTNPGGTLTDYVASSVVFSDTASSDSGVTSLSPTQLTDNGFNQITVYSTGAVTLPKGTNLNLAVDGRLAVKSTDSISIDGDISAPSGTVSLTTTALSTGSTNDVSHDVTLGEGASIDASGNWINDSAAVTSEPGTGPTVVNGGSVTLSAAGNVVLGANSAIDVSGGGWLSSAGKLTEGMAGGIALKSSYRASPTAPYTGTVEFGSGASLVGNSLSASGGGTLTIAAGSVTVGYAASGTPGELLLSPDFFSNKGFKSYSITGENDVVIGSTDNSNTTAVVVNPIQETLSFSKNATLQKTGTKLSSFTRLAALPSSERSAASISFNTTASSTGAGVGDSGDILLGRYASIVTDAGGSVSLDSQGYTGNITVLGTIDAPAGDITLTLGSSDRTTAPGDSYIANQEILLGSSAKLEAQAYAQVDTLDAQGYREGKVLAGGTISLQANKGYVVTEQGSLIDVSGAATSIDITGVDGKAAKTIAGNAGTINIDAREGIVLQGDLRGQAAAVAGAAGGTLNIGLDLFDYVTTVSNNQNYDNPYPVTARTLTLSSQSAAALGNQLQSGTAKISESTLSAGGFDYITLKSADVIAIDGNVSLTTKAGLTLDAPLLQGERGSSLELTSADVALGNYYNTADYFTTTTAGASENPTAATVLSPTCAEAADCTATLNVNAQNIDIRGISAWSGFSSETLVSSGDIRLTTAQNYYGSSSAPTYEAALRTTGDLTLQAQQVYPTTDTDFTMSAGSSVTILPSSGTGTTPLSAGGILTIDAPTIYQYGTLEAPFGDITLNGTDIVLESGSTTSVSANGTLIPYGSTVNGTEWTYSPYSGVTEVITAPVSKTVSLNGSSVVISKGATVNVSGGGDVYAYEWTSGSGGTTDVLASASNGGTYTYAIDPNLGSTYSAIDAQYAQGNSGTKYQTIYISGVPGLKDGWYALLPAHYALLSGAYAIEVVKSDSDLTQGSSVKQADGSYVVSARFGVAGTDIADSRTSTIVIASDAVVRTQSAYTDSQGDTFFGAGSGNTSGTRLAADAGVLSLSATSDITLDGTVDFAAASYAYTDSSGKSATAEGAGGEVSIQAPNIRVVDSGTTTTATAGGTLQIDAQSLDNLGAQVVVLGATATTTSSGEQINVAVTNAVELDNTSVALTAPELIVAAKNQVTVDAGAKINATGTLNQSPSTVVVNGAGALLTASSGGLASVTVDKSSDALPTNAAGQLTLGSAASLSAAGGLLLYSTGNTTAAADVQFSAPALGLYSSRVSVGDVPTGTDTPAGLNLGTQLLSTLGNLTELTIGSSSTIDFYGTVNLGTSGDELQSVTLNSAGLAGYDTGTAKSNVEAGAITLENTGGASLATNQGNSPPGTGTLTLSTADATAKQSGQITLGAGDKSIGGFAAVNLTAAGDIEAQGTGTLSISSTGTSAVPLTMTAAAFTGASSSNESITATGAVQFQQAAASAVTLPAASLGGSLSVTGSSIEQDGTIDMLGGVIKLRAISGDVTLGATSLTSAAGADKSFGVTDSVAAAGTVSLTSDHGSVTLVGGATVDVAGASSADGKVNGNAGTFDVSAPQGQFVYAGSRLEGSAAAGASQGNFSLDVGSGLSGSGFADLVTLLSGSGFEGTLSLRTRTDTAVDVVNPSGTAGDVITASSFALTVDQGDINVYGTINTSGGNATSTDGGAISLWAGTGLTLESGAKLLANAGSAGPVGVNGTAQSAKGGDITLGTSSGTLTIEGGTAQNPTTISMQGTGDSTTDGTLTLRAPRTSDGTNVQIDAALDQTQSLAINTRQAIIVEGVKTYDATVLGSVDAGCGTGGSCDVADTGGLLFTDAQTFINSTSTLPSNLQGLAVNNTVQVRAGIEVDSPTGNGSNGDLTVGDAGTTVWDLNSWNTALGAPVNLTLRAAGNLIFDASLSDGFTDNGSSSGVSGWALGESATNIDSASYRLTAGADLGSSNPLAVVAQDVASSAIAPNTGNVIVTPGNLIRTGDGNIDIAAGGDVLLGYTFGGYDANGNIQTAESDPLSSVIYTAGVPSRLNASQSTEFTTNKPKRNSTDTVSYTTDGGNISVSAADDIRSSPSSQLVSDWLWRRGSTNSDGTLVNTKDNTSWWIDFTRFEQGIGALGGGNITLTAGRDIVNVSAVIPTTGRLLGAAGTTPSTANLIVTGGGTLRVQAGGNIEGGVYENDWGNASITADGNIEGGATLAQETAGYTLTSITSTSTNTPIDPIILAGSGTFSVSADGSVAIEMVSNSTVLPVTNANQAFVGAAAGSAYFYTYSSSSALDITSVGGDVVLNNSDTNLAVANALTDSQGNLIYYSTYDASNFYDIYPSTVNVAALSGDVSILSTNGVGLYPSATGNVSLLAERSITGSTTDDTQSSFRVSLYETDPSLWPSALKPVATLGIPDSRTADLPTTPLYENDSQLSYVIAYTGNISESFLTFPKAADVIAGGNIYQLDYTGKNLHASDVTLIEAGGDITYSSPTDPVSNDLLLNDIGITLGGPGYLEVLAGGTLSLGDSLGIVTTANINDSRLSATGASIVAGAGFGTNADGTMRQPDYADFTKTYLEPDAAGNASAYAGDLIAYMESLDPTTYANVNYSAALAAFKGLTAAQQLPFLSQVLSDELSATGLAHNASGTSYDRGYTAIDTLFPTTDASGKALTYSGNIDLFYSQIKTEQGGNIDLLAPGGSVVAGVTNPNPALSKVKDSEFHVTNAAADLGILVLGSGSIEGFASQNFDVNQSRILTLEGGDIILWASNGSIDAGNGAKSASSTPAPVVVYDSNTGTFSVDASNSVTGSGIGQLLSKPGEKAGLVNLIAPKGAVNAGDAGIRVAGNLNIAAAQVIGAGNISVAGTSTGVPASDAGALAGALSGANSLGDASKNAVEQLTQDVGNAGNYQQLTDSLQPTFIVVKMFCLGIECETQ